MINFKSSSSKYKVFPGSIAMDFIFEFAKNGWVFAKLRLSNDKISLLDTSVWPMIALFSYVNYSGKYKETRTGYCIPIAIYIGKVSKNGSSVDRIVPQVDVTARILNRFKENTK